MGLTPAGAQNVFTVCGLQEFCYCWDEQASTSFTFLPCPDSTGVGVTLLFCSGNMSTIDGVVMRGYDGTDNTGEPLDGVPAWEGNLTGQFPNLAGVSGTSTGAIHIEFDFVTPATVLCSNGGAVPWRWLAWTGNPPNAPVPGDCMNTGPACPMTNISGIVSARRPYIRYFDGNLVLATGLVGYERIEVFDPVGRHIFGAGLQGRSTVPIDAMLVPGPYVVVVSAQERRYAQRIILSE